MVTDAVFCVHEAATTRCSGAAGCNLVRTYGIDELANTRHQALLAGAPT